MQYHEPKIMGAQYRVPQNYPLFNLVDLDFNTFGRHLLFPSFACHYAPMTGFSAVVVESCGLLGA